MSKTYERKITDVLAHGQVSNPARSGKVSLTELIKGEVDPRVLARLNALGLAT